MCCLALSEKNFADGRSVSRRVRRRYGPATVVVLSDSIRLLRCRDGPLSPWSCGYGYSVYGGPGSCKEEGAGWATNCVLRIAYCVLGKGRRDGHDTVVALAGSVPVSNGIDVRSILAAVEGVDRQARCTSVTREIARECVRLGKNFWRNMADGWLAKAARVAGRAQVALEALLRRMEGLHRYERAYERWTRVHESSREIGQESFWRMTADGWLAKAARVVEAGGHRAGWRPFGGGWKGLTGVSACTRVR